MHKLSDHPWYTPKNGPNPWYWVTDNTIDFMNKGYLVDQTVQERVVDIAHAFYLNMLDMGLSTTQAKHYANNLYHYASWGWNSFSTPVWTNYGNSRGLPISCFNSDVDDTMESILYASSEIGMLTKLGGGTSAYLGKLRPRGTPITDNGEADGAAHFADLYNSIVRIARQGKARRGYLAAYLDAEHSDVLEFLDIGTDKSDIQNITTGINLSDSFLQKCLSDDVQAQSIMSKIQKTRGEVGYPYLLFKDNANRYKPQVYKDKDLTIESSNLCSEIFLPSTDDESFVCVLSSLNLIHYDIWRDSELVETMTLFLDTVVEESIRKVKHMKATTKPRKFFLDRILSFMENHRAIGLGVLGFHHYLQSNSIPFDSTDAARKNVEIFKHINSKSLDMSKHLANKLGEPPLLQGYGERFTTRMAIAPTKSSASILGNASESIQPELANVYVAELAKTTQIIRNPYLEKILIDLGQNTKEVWDSIIDKAGSVQHLDFLDDHTKAVFKTFPEISPRVIIDLAAARQPFIDQGQSLNLIFHPETTSAQINAITFYAWKMGIKSLYYQFSMSAAQALNVSKLSYRDCAACSG